jgi:tRNA(Ile)-lysidine synthetase-like protein
VSAGTDSIAAAHWLKYKALKSFKMLHFNHKVQPANELMELSMIQFAKDHHMDCYIQSRNLNDTPKFTDTSENGMRQWRHYKMSGYGGNFITAHHLNDCVENYLKLCFEGKSEYKPIQEFTQFEDFAIYHPFLTTTKNDFINYVIQNDLMKYVVEDPTNNHNDATRNWIRNVIVPEIEGRNIGLEKVVRKKFYL